MSGCSPPPIRCGRKRWWGATCAERIFLSLNVFNIQLRRCQHKDDLPPWCRRAGYLNEKHSERWGGDEGRDARFSIPCRGQVPNCGNTWKGSDRCDSALVEPRHLPQALATLFPRSRARSQCVRLGVAPRWARLSLLILKTLEATNITRPAAEILGHQLEKLHNKLKEYGAAEAAAEAAS